MRACFRIALERTTVLCYGGESLCMSVCVCLLVFLFRCVRVSESPSSERRYSAMGANPPSSHPSTTSQTLPSTPMRSRRCVRMFVGGCMDICVCRHVCVCECLCACACLCFCLGACVFPNRPRANDGTLLWGRIPHHRIPLQHLRLYPLPR